MRDDQEIRMQQIPFEAFIHTEGKTDWKYLQKAKQKLNIGLSLRFYEREDSIGDRNLLQHCKTLAKSIYPQEKPLIFVFDRDDPQVLKEVEEEGKAFKHWGNNVFSFAIPVPTHRIGYGNLSIEFYFSDEELKTKDNNGRRLFLSSEFLENSGRHLQEPDLNYGNRHKLKGITEGKSAKIIDSDVFNQESKNIALSKSEFADNIYRDVPPFDCFDFGAFREIFVVVKSILEEATKPSEEPESAVIPIHIISAEERIYRDSPPVVSIFVGRDVELKKLNNPQIRVAAITGLGGEGKSTLAARFYETAIAGETKLRYTHFGWCDCKDLETPFHQKLLALLEDVTEGEESKEKYADENPNNTVKRFVHALNRKSCLVVFDNVDAFVDKDVCSFTGHVRTLFDFLTTSLSNSLVVFTCRPQINDYHFPFLEVPIGGLSHIESVQLAQHFGILGTKISESDLIKVHAGTKGHALWLNLIFAQIRNERLTAAGLDSILGSESMLLDRHLLRSIWSKLSRNEKELIWTLSTFTRPPDIDRIMHVTDMTYQKSNRIIRSLIRLRMIVEIGANGGTCYDLHPIIRMKAKEECEPEKKKSLCEKAILILSFGNWARLGTIIMRNDCYSTDIDRYVECAEIALENFEFEKALEYIDNLSDGLLKYGEDAKFGELASQLLRIADFEKYQIGIHPKLSSVYKDYILVLLEQGEFAKVDSYLADLNRSLQTIQQYIFHSELVGYSLWFRDDFRGAIEWIESATRHIEAKNEKVPGDMLHDYALALRDAGEVDKALQYFVSKCDLSAINSWDTDSNENLATDAGNISRCYYLKGELEESLRLCKKAVDYLKKGKTRRDRVNHGYGLLWIADIYVKQGSLVEAKGYLEEAAEVWKKYCPSRMDKIRSHIHKYPEEIKEMLPENLYKNKE
jgi:tetratricopeptide (TPR) repeat protein